MSRMSDLTMFYDILNAQRERLGGFRYLKDQDSKQNIPSHGVYFFFEIGEHRSDSGDGFRVVRVGTHALTASSKSTLWKRLSQHRGTLSSGGGNHRGSVFRLHVGTALIRRDKHHIETWGRNGGIGKDSVEAGVLVQEAKNNELLIEIKVSQAIRNMPFICLGVSSAADRDFIEKNSVALLSNFNKIAIDRPSEKWLGNHSAKNEIRKSGLWNSNYVEREYEPGFLGKLDVLSKTHN